MYAQFSGGYIRRTDYFRSVDRDRGKAWLALAGRNWHVLLPERPMLVPPMAAAWAVPEEDEPEGWQWCLRVHNRLWRLPCRQILGPRPALPEGGLRWRRGLVLYSSELERGRGQSFFGSIEPGVQVAAELQVVLTLCQG